MHGPPGQPGVHRKTYNHKDRRSARNKGHGETMEHKIATRDRIHRERLKKRNW